LADFAALARDCLCRLLRRSQHYEKPYGVRRLAGALDDGACSVAMIEGAQSSLRVQSGVKPPHSKVLLNYAHENTSPLRASLRRFALG